VNNRLDTQKKRALPLVYSSREAQFRYKMPTPSTSKPLIGTKAKDALFVEAILIIYMESLLYLQYYTPGYFLFEEF
jgi:hypothetical protein